MNINSKLSRRAFLRYLSAGTCGAAIHQVLSPANGFMAFAAPSTAAAYSANPVMILVNFGGGASYNVAPPYAGEYINRNPNISYNSTNSIPIAGDQGIHPSLTHFGQMFTDGDLAVCNMVGYPNPNRSHADSTDIWFSGTRTMNSSAGGWAAKLTCQIGGLFSGISLGGSNLLIQGDCNPPRSFNNLQNFGEDRFAWGAESDHFRNTRNGIISQLGAPQTPKELVVRNAIFNTELSVATVQQAISTPLPTLPGGIAFPNSGFGNSCRDAARLINAPQLQTRFIYLERGGFDTHSGERNALTGNLNDVNAGIRALVESVKLMGRWNDVVIVTMSEFCRTFENGSQGTDHGHSAPLFVAGGSIRGRQVNAAPTNAETLAANQFYSNYNIDFRQILKEIVSNMGYDGNMVFPEALSFTPIGLF